MEDDFGKNVTGWIKKKNNRIWASVGIFGIKYYNQMRKRKKWTKNKWKIRSKPHKGPSNHKITKLREYYSNSRLWKRNYGANKVRKK